MLNMNVRSIISNCDEFEGFLHVYDADVSVLTETWLHESMSDNNIIPHSHEMVRLDRCARGGGVAIVIKEGFQYSLLHHNTNVEMVWIVLRVSNLSILIGAAYRPPNADYSMLESLHDFLGEHSKRYSHIIMGGDFNLPNINWNLLCAHPSSRHSDLLLDIAFSYNFKQVVDMPTRVTAATSSCLDLVFISDTVSRLGFGVDLLPGISDHNMILFKSNIRRPETRGAKTTFLDFNHADDASI